MVDIVETGQFGHSPAGEEVNGRFVIGDFQTVEVAVVVELGEAVLNGTVRRGRGVSDDSPARFLFVFEPLSVAYLGSVERGALLVARGACGQKGVENLGGSNAKLKDKAEDVSVSWLQVKGREGFSPFGIGAAPSFESLWGGGGHIMCLAGKSRYAGAGVGATLLQEAKPQAPADWQSRGSARLRLGRSNIVRPGSFPSLAC